MKHSYKLLQSVLLLVLLIALASIEVRSQALSSYCFTSSAGTYSSISATGTSFRYASADDAYSPTALPIGFTFNLAGTNYTSCFSNTNGFITFNPNTALVGVANTRTTALNTVDANMYPLIAAYKADLMGANDSGFYQTIGTAPNRVFIVEWKNWGVWSYLAPPSFNFQIRLYEGSNRVEFVYELLGGTQSTITGTGVAVTSADFMGINNLSASPVASSATASTTVAGRAATGQVYGFIQPSVLTYGSSTTIQNSSFVPSGSTNAQVIAVPITMSGCGPFQNVSQFVFNTTGTTNTAHISNAKVFYTGTSNTFAATNQFGTTVASPNGTFIVNGTQGVGAGTSYFWLTYDVSPSAANGAIIDAECAQFTLNGASNSPTVTAPAGGREVKAPLNGTYTVGASGNYPTLTAAVSELNNLGVSGPVTFTLTDAEYSTATGEVFPITISNVAGVNASRPITITPQSSVSPLITDSNANSIFIIQGTKYVIIDGRWGATNNGRNLTIQNTSLNAAANVIVLRNEVTGSVIRNTEIRFSSVNTNTNPTNGAIYVAGTSNLLGVGNDSLLIRNNTIAPALGNYYATGINFTGQSLTQQNDWATIDSNWFYGHSLYGIFINSANTGVGRQFTITGNSFYDTVTVIPNPKGYITFQHADIFFNASNANSWGHQITGNYMGGQSAFVGGNGTGLPRQLVNPGTSSPSIYKIYYSGSNTTAGTRISGNVISNIIYNQGGTASFYYPYFNYISGGYVDITDNIMGHLTDTNNIRFDNNSGATMYLNYMFHTAPTEIKRNTISGVTVNSNTAVGFIGFYFSATTIGVASVDSNVIQRFFTRSSSTSTATNAAFCGFAMFNATPTFNMRGNRIGGPSPADSISIFSSSPLNPGTSVPAGTRMIGIYNGSGITNLSNNYIGNFYTNSNATSGLTSAAQLGIYQVSGTGGSIVSGNTVTDFYANAVAGTCQLGIGSASAAITLQNNVVRNFYSYTNSTGLTTNAAINGIAVSSSQQHNILNNSVFNLNTYTSAATQINGIVASVSGQNLIRGNNIYKLYSATTASATSTSAGIIGISNISGAANQVIDSNNVYHLVAANNLASSNPSIIGILHSGSSLIAGNTSAVSRNKIWGLTTAYPVAQTPVASVQYGIQYLGGTGVVANNMISIGRDSAGVVQLRPGQYRGIFVGTPSTSQIRIYHNNINVDLAPDYGTAGTPNPSTGCLEISGNASGVGLADVVNNIFVNSSVNGGSSSINHYNEMYSTSMTSINTNTNIIHNAGAANSFMGRFNATNYATLNNFRTVTARAGASGFASPNFVAPAASIPDLNLGASNPAEGMGDTTLITYVPTDINGLTRSGRTPVDIGAGSGNNTLSSDVIAPLIYFTPLSNTSSPASRTVSATIFEGTQLPLDTAIGPRVYFKKSTQLTWVSNPGALISTNGKNRSYNFTIDHALLGGIIPGDIIQYYLVAADSAAGNINSNVAYAVGTATNNITVHPTTPNQYLFNDPIPTTVYIGTGSGSPSYPTLTGPTGLFNAINNSALQGNTTVLIQSSVTEPATVELAKWLEVGTGGYKLTIRPVNNSQYILSGTSTAGLIRFNNTENVSILGFDSMGSVNDTNLIIRVSANGSALVFNNGGASDTVRNVIFETRAAGNGNVFISGTTVTRGFSNALFENCHFRQDLTGTTLMTMGLYGFGTSPRLNTNITVNNCSFYNFTSNGVNFTTGTGDNMRITNNHFFYNYGTSTSTSLIPITLQPGSSSNGNLITGNYIGGNSAFAQGSPWTNSASVTFTGISSNTGTAAGTTINGNVVQNINLTSTTGTGTFTGILAQGTSAVYTVNNNRVGSFTLPIYSLNNARFIGISTTSSGNVTIQNDSVLNIQVINTGTTAGITGINSTGGSSNVVNINNNIISGLFTTSGNTGTTTAAAVMGILSTHSTLSLNITNNTVRTLVASNTTATHSMRGIIVSGGAPNISNNTVYGLSSRSTYTGTLTLANLIGIANTSTFNNTFNMNNNIVDSLGCTNGSALSTQLIGILLSSSGVTQTGNVNNNIVQNLVTTSSNTGTLTSSALVGIMISGTGTVNANYNDNKISNLSHRVTNAAVSVAGLYIATSISVNGNNSTVARNLIHSLSSTATPAIPVLTGLQVNQGFVTVANNMIRMGIDSAGTVFTNPAVVRGIWHQNATQAFYYHNSVLVSGNTATSNSNTAAFESNASITAGQQMDVRNNIFANTAINAAGTGFNFGIRYQDSLRINSNYNIVYTPGTNGIAAGIVATNSRYALLGGDSSSWKAIVGLDMASSAANPSFDAAATAAAPNVNLNLMTSNPAEKSGDPSLVSVTNDYYGNARSGLTPSDIGAHAGNFSMSPDAFGPSISYTLLSNAGTFTGTRALNNVTITDNNGIINSGANRPKIYYSRDGSTWYSASANTVTGTATNATASFTIDYLAFTPSLTLADTIRYFVVAQDGAGNVTSSPALAVGTDVHTITQYPRNPNRYSFLPVISANTVISVGAGQTYTSLTNAGGLFEFINSRTLGGHVVAEITSDLIGETGAVALNKFAEDGAGSGSFTLTIRPNAGTVTPRLIQGSYNNPGNFYGLITLLGADRVKLTGIPTGGNNTQRLLRIRNTAASGTYAASTGSGVIVVSSATGVAISNCIIESGNSNTAGGGVEFRVGVGNQYLTTPCSFDTVTNCVMTNNTIATLPDGIPANAGLYSFGAPNVYNNNIVFTNNQVSNFVTAGVGVVGNNGDGFVITGNSFFYDLGYVPSVTGTFQGIVFIPGSFSSGNVISNNYIGGSAINCGGAMWVNPNNLGFNGIRVQVGNGANTIINGNVIRNISFSNTAATTQGFGIQTQSGNATITNNIVGDATMAGGINWLTSASFFGIAYQGVNNLTMQNNTVQGINIGTPNTFAQFYGIYITGGTVTSPISGNVVGHPSNADNIIIASNTNSYGIFSSILVAYSPTYTLSNNTVANITCTGTGTGSIIYGIAVQNSAFPTVTNNTVSNLRTACISNTTTGVASGIVVQVGATTVASVTNNNVRAIRATNTGTAPTIVHGIIQTSGQDNVISGNRVWDITNASTSTSIYPAPVASGIGIGGGSTTTNLYNNQITLGNGNSANTQFNGIWLYTSNTALTLNAVNNSVLVDGASAGGNQNSYALLRGNNTGSEMFTNINLRNNILANRRTGGSGNHYAISNQATSPSNSYWNATTSTYNLLVTENTNSVGQWGLGANDLANWRTNSSSDVLSYYVQSGSSAGQLNLNNLFTNIAASNLGIQTANAEVWYLYGKGITGASANNLNTDYAGNSRSTSQGIATTIGSVHMTSAPSTLPIAAVASAAPAANTTTSYTFANRPVASISWGASAPTAATVYDFTGVNPPAAPAGNYNNRYVRADVSGGTAPYNYGLTYNFNAANLGGMQNANNMRLATSNAATPTSWTTQFTTSANASTGIASVTGISTTGSAITFTGTELTAPPTISGFTPSAKEAGGAVTIRGSLFTGSTAVSFNGTAQPTFTVVNDTTITTTVPVGATTGTVSVTNPYGTGTSSSTFTVIPAPTVTGLSTTSGTIGASVTITGTGFTWATQVQFNTTNATFTVVSNTSITCTVPAGATSGAITVTNPAGNASSATFTVIPAPSVTSFTPGTGPVGTSVSITGTDFQAITNVRFNGINSSYTVNSPTSITATVPSGATTGLITVLNGTGTGTSASNFTVTTPPTINSFSPSAGGIGSVVSINGTNLTGATVVSFNGTNATTFTVVNSTTINATVPTGATSGAIAVTTPSGSASSSTNFTVYTDLIVSTVQSVSGIYNNITVTGTGVANLTGSLQALGNTTIQSGGIMNFGTNVLNSNGNFTANGGSLISTAAVDGISATGGVTGSIQVSGTRTYSGRVEYNGASAQSTGDVNADSIVINNTNGVSLNASRALNSVQLIVGWLSLGNNNLTINNGGSITGANASSWIRTSGNGTLRRTVANNNTAVLFPIGIDAYTPAQITLTVASTTDVFSARVISGVFTNGSGGLPVSTSMVNRTWILDETVAGGSNATVTFQWVDTMEAGGFNRTNCGVSYFRNVPSSWIPPVAYAAAAGSNPYTASRSGMSVFGAFAVGDNLSTAALPVQILQFTANRVADDVAVNWSTASEYNNSHFEVERSYNGTDYVKAGHVAGNGFTTAVNNYSFVDKGAVINTTANTIYYRLKQVDFDGGETFFGPVAVNITKPSVDLTVSAFPNPFSGAVTLTVLNSEAGNLQITVSDMQGRLVYTGSSEVNKGSQLITIDTLKDLKDGVYFVNTTLNGKVTRLKLVKAGN